MEDGHVGGGHMDDGHMAGGHMDGRHMDGGTPRQGSFPHRGGRGAPV
ncbi:hypothetical protein SVIOM342S_10594 [Streptomyces violaceorubidus]